MPKLSIGTDGWGWRLQNVPYFYFDLTIGRELEDQGSMILEDLAVAADRADQLADELYIVRPELRSRHCAIRVTNGEGNELYRTPIDPVSAPTLRKP
jgi:hypothetical protein